jgi:hypothetical protein
MNRDDFASESVKFRPEADRAETLHRIAGLERGFNGVLAGMTEGSSGGAAARVIPKMPPPGSSKNAGIYPIYPVS